jgi:hypothetical protein
MEPVFMDRERIYRKMGTVPTIIIHREVIPGHCRYTGSPPGNTSMVI